MNTRREIVKSGAGLAAILAAGKAPAVLVRSMAATRGAMMAGGGVYHIDSVMSDGTAYTACAHVFQTVDSGRLRVLLKGASDLAVSDIKHKNCFGGSLNDSSWLFNNYNDGSTISGMDFQVYLGTTGSGVRIWTTLIANGFHEIVIQKTSSVVSVSLDGRGLQTFSINGQPTKGRVCVFTQNNRSGNEVVPVANRVPRKVSIAAFQLWEGETLVSDLQPSIAPDGEICFYDAVVKDYARNMAGSGSFLIGDPLI